MTLNSIAFFVGIFCISTVIGALLGIFCRGRVALTLFLSLVLSLSFFAALEWRFGIPEEWSWRDPITSSAYLVGPFAALVAAPTILAALFVGRWWLRHKVI